MKLLKVACYLLSLLATCSRGVEQQNGTGLNPLSRSQISSNDRKKFQTIAETIGKILSGADEICMRLDSTLVLNGQTECFKYGISRVTDNLFALCVNSNQSNDTGNLPNLYYFTDKLDEFDKIDYYLFLKSVNLLLERITSDQVGYFIEIAENVLKSNFAKIYNYFLSKRLYEILYDLKEDFIMNSTNLVIFSWYPFQRNISGFVLYENRSPGGISNDEAANDIDFKGVKMAGYVPEEFLVELTTKLRLDEEVQMRILMLFSNKASKFRDIFDTPGDIENLIGIAIPGFCKSNTLPMLRAYFKPLDNNIDKWLDFGREYIDSLQDFDWYKCVLNQTSFFGQRSSEEEPYELPKQNYCMPYTINATSFDQTLSRHLTYPQQFCMNNELEIPSAYCSARASYILSVDNANCASLPMSNKTEILYGIMRKCSMHGECDEESFLMNYNASDTEVFADAKLYFEIFVYLSITDASAKQIGVLCDVFGKGLENLGTQTQSHQKISYASTLLLYFLLSLPSNYVGKIVHEPNYSYQRISDNYTYGSGIFYNENEGTHKMFQITTPAPLQDYSNDSIEAVTRYSVDDSHQLVLDHTYQLDYHYPITVNIFFLYDASLVEDEEYFCRSRIVSIYHNSVESPTFLIYLKALDGSGEKYWVTVKCKTKVVNLVFLREFRINKTREVVMFVEDRVTVVKSDMIKDPFAESSGIRIPFKLLLYLLLLLCLAFIVFLDVCLYY